MDQLIGIFELHWASILLWLFAASGIASFALKLYRWLLPSPGYHLSTLTPPDVTVNDLPGLIATQLGTRLDRGNRVTHLLNGDEIFPPMLEAIRNAKKSVDLLTYVYWQGDIADEFAEALVATSKRGVRVRVLLDAVGSAKMKQELIERMEEAGCQVSLFHPIKWYAIERFNFRTHRKILVVDDEIAFTGGVGIAKEWTGNAQDPNHWRDDHFQVEGPAVAGLWAGFAENWRQSTGEVLDASEAFEEFEPVGQAVVVSVRSIAEDQPSATGFCYWISLYAAQKTLDITTPYFVPREELQDALIAAVKRGVRVRLLMPNDHNDSTIARVASRNFYGDLIDAGVEVYEYQPTMIHTKTLVADGRWSIFGSANWDGRSFDLNHELIQGALDDDLANALTASFETDLKQAERVTRERFDDRPLWSKLIESTMLLVRKQI